MNDHHIIYTCFADFQDCDHSCVGIASMSCGLLRRWSEEQSLRKSIVTYAVWLGLCELQGRRDEVDALMLQCWKQGLKPNEVILGDLIARAASLSDSRRADVLWETFVVQHKVEPHFLAYTAYAQVHLLTGSPQKSLGILDDMIKAGQVKRKFKLSIDYRLANTYLQALLIVCHSSTSFSDGARLADFLDTGAEIVRKKSSAEGKALWKVLEALSEKLLYGPKRPRFKDLLVSKHAKNSSMKTWGNHLAGTKYLPSS